MQEKEIYNAKKELANLYLIIKNKNSQEVIIIYIDSKNVIFLFSQKETINDEFINELMKTKSLKDLIEYVKSSIDVIITLKTNEGINNYNNVQYNPAIEYELLLQKEEQNNREHISIEHQFKIQCEKYAQELDYLEDEKSVLLMQIVSYIKIIKYYNMNKHRIIKKKNLMKKLKNQNIRMKNFQNKQKI